MILLYFSTIFILALVQYYVVVLSNDIELKILFERLFFRALYMVIFIWLFYIALIKEIGTSNNDTGNYIRAFQLMSDSIYDYKSSQDRLLINGLSFEPLYLLLMQFWISFINNNWLVAVSAFTILSIVLTFTFFNKNTKLYYLAILLYSSHFLWVKDFNQLRNAMASAIVWFLPALWHEKRWKFFLILAVAISIQSASVFILVALFFSKYLSKYFLDHRGFLFLLIISIILYYTNVSSFIFVNVFANISSQASAYLYRSSDIADRGVFANPVVIKGIIFSLIFIANRDNLIKRNSSNGYYINIYIFGILWTIIFSGIGIFANRFASYVTGFECLLMAEILCFRKNIWLFGVVLVVAVAQFYIDYILMLVPQV